MLLILRRCLNSIHVILQFELLDDSCVGHDCDHQTINVQKQEKETH